VETIWFLLVAGMLTAYVVLDGFDLGAGALHLIIARTESERRTVLRAIGPVWDGNEVWLLAGGGTLYFAFPLLYASGFSGFYLPLMIVLWLLILRGIGIEFRTHIASTVWRGLFDGLFALSSVFLSVFYGAALANVIRGVPLQADGYFFEPLWTDWRVGPQPGVLDWYTVIGGLTALVALAVHGAAYLALKTEGDLNARARRAVIGLSPALVLLTAVSLLATIYVRPNVLDNFRAHAILVIIPLVVVAALAAIPLLTGRRRERAAFQSSAAFLAAMLAGAAVALYPTLLPASGDATLNITIFNAAAGRHALSVGLIWWSAGMLLAIGYFVFIYRMFGGKVSTAGVTPPSSNMDRDAVVL
jgi:cytochrome d ubiquinol oxidase subunit II